MGSDSNNKVDYRRGGISAILLLKEAEDLARTRNCTKDFALYIMYAEAQTVGNETKAAACMDLLEREFIDSVSETKKESEKDKEKKKKD